MEKHKFRERKKTEGDGRPEEGGSPAPEKGDSKDGAKGRGREGRGRSPPHKDRERSPPQRCSISLVP